MRQDRFGIGIADAGRKTRDGVKAVDRDLVAGRKLRAQTGLAQRVHRAMPEGDDLGQHEAKLYGITKAKKKPRRR
ncbi:hypothetical protein ACVWYH_003466 [Bradyrhizobium sp. GM24.11]